MCLLSKHTGACVHKPGCHTGRQLKECRYLSEKQSTVFIRRSMTRLAKTRSRAEQIHAHNTRTIHAPSRADLDAALATNVKGYAFGVKHAARAMQRNPGDARKLTAGAIVNIASTSGLVAQPGFVPYSMTKAAVMQLSRCAALDLSKHGIRCVLQARQAGYVWKLRSALGCAWGRSRTLCRAA